MLGHYGALLGTMVMRQLRLLIKDNSTSLRERVNTTKMKNLSDSISSYIPFGERRCISVFLDIRGLTDLIGQHCEEDGKQYISFIQVFSSKVEVISAKHFGVVSSHFGGGMLITFNQTVYDTDNDLTCFTVFALVKA